MSNRALPRRAARWLHLGCAALLLVAAVGCRNSILRNVSEAGMETALEDPLPTPTARL